MSAEERPSDWRDALMERMARECEVELLQLRRDFGAEPPWTSAAVVSAMGRLSLKYAASRAALDGRLFTSWLLQRYARTFSPAYVIKKGYAEDE